MPLLFLFLDGVGLGAADPQVNPFAAAKTPFLEALLGGPLTAERPAFRRARALFTQLDARLGFPGLPQSATGQTTLLTGQNGAARMGRHYGPWPGPTLKSMLDEGTLFTEASAAGLRVGFANAFPATYFEALRCGERRVNVPVYTALGAGLALPTTEDYRRGQAVSADLDGTYLHGLEAQNPHLPLPEAGARLAAIAKGNDLTFFDFWLSDTAGHRWSFPESVALIERLDAFLSGLVPALGETTLLVTSDHGNLEDKITRSHTTNPVPLLALGPRAACFAGVEGLLGVAPAARRALAIPPPAASAG